MWYKWAKRILAGIGIFIALLFGIATLIIYLYEDEIKQYAVKELNKNLIVPVEVKELDLTLFSQFPSASLRFSELYIEDTTNNDTLIYAENLYLNFNFWDMIYGNYKVKEIQTDNSVVKLKVDSSGYENYLIWKKDTLANKDEKFSFALEEVSFNNINLGYRNQVTNQVYKIDSKNIQFSGNFSESNYNLTASSKFFIDQFESNSVSYIHKKNATANLVVNINRDSSYFQLNKAEFSVEDLLFDIDGKYTNRADSSYMDLNIKGRNIDLQTAFSIFPKEYFETLSKYNATGMIVFETKIEGIISKTKSPKIISDFNLSNGSLKEINSGAQLRQLSLEGHFENRNQKNVESLQIKNLKGELENGDITGEISISNFQAPLVDANIKGDLSLSNVKQFINSKKIEVLTGNAKFNIQFIGAFNLTQIAKTVIKKSDGFISLENISFKTTANHIALNNVSGDLTLRKNDAAFSNLTGSLLSSQFKADGIVKNIIPFLLQDNQQLIIETDFKSKTVDLNELLVSNNSNQNEATPLNLPSTINLNLKAHIGEVIYDKFTASNVKGIVTLENQKLIAKNLSFKANKGTYIISTELEQTGENGFFWTVEATANNIDIQNFFYQLNNFGQEYITDKNINGKTSVELSMGTVMDGYMNIDLSRLYSTANFTITKGELINQSSLLDIANYFESNKLVNSAIDTKTLKKKLKHVKFSNLQNQIVIEKGKIFIPRLNLETNVMDLGISGTHSFNNDVDYHLNFRLNEVLKKKTSDEEFGPIKDDGLGVKLFLHMYGNISNLQYKLDKEEKKLERKESIKEEKQELKSILKEEFGLFKTDSSLKTPTKEKASPTFEVEWDEFDKEPNVEPENNEEVVEKEKKKDKNKGINKFLKKLGVEEEQKKEVKMEIDN